MDIGELENPYSYDKCGSKHTQTGTSGPLQIGDYDEKQNGCSKQQAKATEEDCDNKLRKETKEAPQK